VPFAFLLLGLSRGSQCRVSMRNRGCMRPSVLAVRELAVRTPPYMRHRGGAATPSSIGQAGRRLTWSHLPVKAGRLYSNSGIGEFPPTPSTRTPCSAQDRSGMHAADSRQRQPRTAGASARRGLGRSQLGSSPARRDPTPRSTFELDKLRLHETDTEVRLAGTHRRLEHHRQTGTAVGARPGAP
jgi:hypothetical protein